MKTNIMFATVAIPPSHLPLYRASSVLQHSLCSGHHTSETHGMADHITYNTSTGTKFLFSFIVSHKYWYYICKMWKYFLTLYVGKLLVMWQWSSIFWLNVGVLGKYLVWERRGGSWRYRGLGGNEFMAGPRPRLLLTILIGCFTAARL